MSVHALLTVHVSAVRSFEREMNEHSSYSLGRFVASLRKEFSKVINSDEKEDCLKN